MHEAQNQVREFHRVVLAGPTSPAWPEIRHGELRSSLILEEAVETVIALVGTDRAADLLQKELSKMFNVPRSEPDLVEAIDGGIDLLYVTYGTFEDIGVDAEPFFNEVHAANMRKVDPGHQQNVSKSPLGKVLKPAGWRPPDIEGVLARMRAGAL